MRNNLILVAVATVAGLLAGCASYPPGAERGPNGTMAFTVLVEASPPGAKVQVNGEVVGTTPFQLKIFGDKDGTFHDFGYDYYVVRGLPITTNQFAQTQWYGTGRWFGPESRIPDRIYFDMNQKTPSVPPPVGPPPGTPVYVYPPPFYYGPAYYYGPRYGYPYRRW